MDAIDEYCSRNTSAPDDSLNAIYRSIMLHTHNPQMSSTPYQGMLLQILTRIATPTLAVEVGCFAGYGTVSIARGLPKGGILHAIEVDEEREEMIRKHLAMTSLSDRVCLHIGPALDIIPTLPDNIDLAFVDADKTNYLNYYRLLLNKTRPGGILIFDNMLWYGRVTQETDSQLRCDRSTRTIQQLNKAITDDPRIENILLPIRDGLMVCRVKD